MKTLAPLCLLVLLLTMSASPTTARSAVVQQLDSGWIEWSAAAVKANGVIVPEDTDDEDRRWETPPARIDAARQVAEARLMETVASIRIDAVSQVADRMATSAAFRDGLTHLAHNATVTRQEYLSDGTVEIELAMKLTGGFAQFVLPEDIRQVETLTTMADRRPFIASPAVAVADAAEAFHTGLILDATNIDMVPAMVPLIVDETGAEVYGPAFVSREFAVSAGMTGFATSVQDALENEKRVGDRPLVVKVIRTDDRGPTVLVITNADAAKLRSSAAHLDFLKNCRVCIVMGQRRSPITPPGDLRMPSHGG